MQTLPKPKKAPNLARQAQAGKPAKAGKAGPLPQVAEQALGIRVCALSLVLLLVLAASSYVPTVPALIFIYALVAMSGSYLAYIYRNDRPRWLSALPTVGAILLFANFIFELSFALAAGAATAVTAFVHMLAGLLALHCFDLRTRTDFSINALIGLGLLTFLTGVARDFLFGIYVMIYTVLGGMLLFYDSSSRSHEIGPSKAVADGQVEGQPMIRRLRVASLTAMLPIFVIPILSAFTCLVLPKTESMLEMFVDNFRSQFPLSATLGGYLSRGGRSQSVKGGSPTAKQEGGASYSAKGGEGPGTASSAGPPGGDGKGSGPGGSGKGQTGPIDSKATNKKASAAMPGYNGKKDLSDLNPGDLKMQATLAKERRLYENYEKETIELHSAPANLEEVVLKVGSPIATYVRRYTLDFYDGTAWKRAMPVPAKVIVPTNKVGFDLTASDAVYVPPDLPTQEIKQEYRLETSMGYILPHSWIPQIVKLDNSEIRIDGDSTIKLLTPLPEKAHYTVTAQIPIYDLEVMRRLPPETLYQLDEDREDELKTAQACLQLPPTINPKIKDMAADAAGIEGNWFSKAERIGEYVKSHYKYDPKSFYDAPASSGDSSTSDGSSSGSTIGSTTGSTTGSTNSSTLGAVTGTLPGSDSASGSSNALEGDKSKGAGKGTGANTTSSGANSSALTKKPAGPSDLDQFLFDKKVGNCRHFASAFVVLCRSQGIPARMVVGFNPGQFNKKNGYHEIKGKDTHVWAEVYIPYWNWVPFDPTPGGGLPAHQEGGNALTKFISSGLANPFGQNVNQRPHHKPPKTNIGAADSGSQKPDENKGNGPGPNFDQNKNKPKGSTFNLPILGMIDQSQMQSVVKLVGAIILLLALAVAVIVYLRQQKTARVKELLGDHPPSTMVFLEVLGELKRYDFNKLPTETADELSDRARSQFAQLERGGRHIPEELPEVVSEFMELYNQERFGGADNLDELHELSQRIKALSGSPQKVRGGR